MATNATSRAGSLLPSGVTIFGRGEDGGWFFGVHGSQLHIFGEDPLDAAAEVLSGFHLGVKPSGAETLPIAGLFAEASDDVGVAACSAVSEFNALVAERARPLPDALRLLAGLLQEAAEDEIPESALEVGGCEDSVITHLAESPRIHEAAVIPASGDDIEFQASMERLVSSFSIAAAELGDGSCIRPPSASAEAVLILRHCKWDDAEALRHWRSDAASLAEAAGVRAPLPLRLGAATVSRGWRTRAWRCGICFDDFDKADAGFALDCDHPYCSDCWCRHLAVMSRGGAGGGRKVLDITCPEPGCKLLVSKTAYEQLKLTTLHGTYQRALLQAYLEESGAVAECPGCGRRVLHGPARPDTGPCRHCSRRFCSLCFQEPHGPLTCSEHRSWSQMVADAKQGLIKNWATRLWNFIASESSMPARRCPNPECNVMSQKIDGCLFICCPRCREQWCWNCGAWGGGPSGREKPHHVFVCMEIPSDPTWLDGHARLNEDARFGFHLQLWEARDQGLIAACAWLADPTAQEQCGIEDITGEDRRQLQRASCQLPLEVGTDLAEAAAEAWQVLRLCAAWRFFSRSDTQRRLFEFAELDLTHLLTQPPLPEAVVALARRLLEQASPSASVTPVPGRSFGSSEVERAQALAAALRTQSQAMRTYRQAGGN